MFSTSASSSRRSSFSASVVRTHASPSPLFWTAKPLPPFGAEHTAHAFSMILFWQTPCACITAGYESFTELLRIVCSSHPCDVNSTVSSAVLHFPSSMNAFSLSLSLSFSSLVWAPVCQSLTSSTLALSVHVSVCLSISIYVCMYVSRSLYVSVSDEREQDTLPLCIDRF